MSDKVAMAGGEAPRLADTEAALEKLTAFYALLEVAHGHGDLIPTLTWEQLHKMQPLMEGIAHRIDPDNVAKLTTSLDSGAWRFGDAKRETLRLIGILEQQEDHERILGLVGPTLAANRLHPWVWNAAASLWDDGYFGKAVEDAYNKVERETQQSVGRLNLYGKDLYAQAFSLDDPKADMPRLRFPHLDRARRLLSKWCGSWRWGGVGAAGWPVGPVGLGRAARRGRLRG